MMLKASVLFTFFVIVKSVQGLWSKLTIIYSMNKTKYEEFFPYISGLF